ncbi:glycosyltransferase family 4 protein [bacterium]|nr:glycosyltransferase family 4 protein [candidate division CSSED10-310 bacterium]
MVNVNIKPNILVAQLGARRHYIVPATLNKYGMLHDFYTDIFLKSSFCETMVKNIASRFGLTSVKRLAGRHSSQLPLNKIHTFPVFGLRYKYRGRFSNTDESKVKNWLWGGKTFCESIIKRSWEGVTGVYSFSSAALELLQKAKNIKICSILDMATALRKVEYEIYENESAVFPGWADSRYWTESDDAYHNRQLQEIRVASTIICSSTYVKRMIQNVPGFEKRLSVLPIGFDSHFSQPTEKSSKGPLKILCIANGGILKGFGYLARAVKNFGSNLQTRVVGELTVSQTAKSDLSENLELFGSVPRTEIAGHYEWADVFVLPSLSETFGLVILEAMSYGLPVITTDHTAGPDIIRQEGDGYIVPAGDSEAIAEKLEWFLMNRQQLPDMSSQAYERSREFSMEKYGEKLVSIIRECTAGSSSS